MSVPTTAATYRGTSGTFLRTGGWALLLDVRPGDPLATRCWDRLQTTTEPDDVLETIVADGLRATPAFALVRETGTTRVIARGAAAVVVDGTDLLHGDPDRAWFDVELAVASTVVVALTADGLTGPTLPLRDGAAAGAGFRLVIDAGARLDVSASVDHLLDATQTWHAEAEDDADHGTGAAEQVTVRRTGVGRPQPGRTGPKAPRVLAALCPAGHTTPAYSGTCRVCGQDVAAQDAFETARPTLGRLVLPQGDPLPLDRGAVLGRAPYVPADWVGPPPRLVALPEDGQDVSAQHVAVLLDLWNVLACDLGSTNGTTLLGRSGEPTRLRPYEPVALVPGDVLVLADVLALPFEVNP